MSLSYQACLPNLRGKPQKALPVAKEALRLAQASEVTDLVAQIEPIVERMRDRL